MNTPNYPRQFAIVQIILFAILFLFIAGLAASATDFSDLVDRSSQSIVRIDSSIELVTGKTERGLGTGFFVDRNLIATNYHVLNPPEFHPNIVKSKTFTIRMKNSPVKYYAREVWGDKSFDLAFLELVVPSVFYNTYENMQPLPLIDTSNHVKEGSEVIVIGHPWNMDFFVSIGTVSKANLWMEPNVAILTDTKVFPGNSGGPALNEKGEVIGVTSAFYQVKTESIPGSMGVLIESDVLKKAIKSAKAKQPFFIPDLPFELGTDPIGFVKIVSTTLDVPIQNMYIVGIKGARDSAYREVITLKDVYAQFIKYEKGDKIFLALQTGFSDEKTELSLIITRDVRDSEINEHVEQPKIPQVLPRPKPTRNGSN